MNRPRSMITAGVLLVALVLAVFAYTLAKAQSEDRDEVEQRFEDVASVAAAVTDGIFQTSFASAGQQATTRLGDAQVDERSLELLTRTARRPYSKVVDENGRTLAATANAPRENGEAVEMALEGGRPRLSDAMGTGQAAAIESVVPFPSETGQRAYVQGIAAKALSDFLAASLDKLPNFADAEIVMVDGKGTILGGTNLNGRVGDRLHDEELLEALAESDHGEYGNDRYFASGPITDSPYRVVAATTKSDLYEGLSGSNRIIPWIIFAAFALAALAGLYLLRRASLTAAQLERRELNERHAVEINDNIIQGLAVAKYQLQMGQGQASADQVAATLTEAQRLVSELLGDAEVQAGQLRRGSAADMGRPPEAPEAPRDG